MQITTIKLTKETKKRLERLKSYKRETFEELVQKVLDILNTCRINPLAARAKLLSISKKKVIKRKQIKRSIQIQRPQVQKINISPNP